MERIPGGWEQPIRLLAVDLDDTLLTSDLRISPRSRQALRRARERGVQVVLATGRMFISALPFARLLGLDGPMICYNGATVRRVGDGRILRRRPLPLPLALKLVREAQRRSIDIHAYIHDDLLVAEEGEAVRYYERVAGVKAQVVRDVAACLEARGQDPDKLLCVVPEGKAPFWRRFFQEVAGGAAHVTGSKSRFVEMMSAGVDKGEALAWLAGTLGLQPEQVMALGDSYNDMEMLRYAGLGVAMGNAPAAVQEAVGRVTGDHDHDGVAEAVEKYILG